MTEQRTKIDGYTAYWRTAGDPRKQHLIFFNGWGARLDGFLGSHRVIAELAKYFYVVSPELPGFMRSDPPETVWTVEDFAHFARKVLLPLNIQNPVIMGQSFGGGIAALYAKFYGEGARCLILVDAVLSGRRQNWYFRLRYWMPTLARLVNAPFVPVFLQRCIWSAYLGVPHAVLKRRNVRDYMVMAQFQASQHCIPDVDYRKLSMPLLLVWGDRDTWVSDMARAKQVHDEVPNSAFVVVKGPHTVLYRRPEYVINEIIGGLNRLLGHDLPAA
ncbi:MAG: alpha/beta hydrolase [bacterium]|nr:alpha/beta hydrolase [bacterium]MDZ4296452.1 alpha/beta hydrolase [Patescibacteria group bacterium]